MNQWRQILSWAGTTGEVTLYVPTMREKSDYPTTGASGFKNHMITLMMKELLLLGFEGARMPKIGAFVEQETMGPSVGEGDVYYGEVSIRGPYDLMLEIRDAIPKIDSPFFLTDQDDMLFLKEEKPRA